MRRKGYKSEEGTMGNECVQITKSLLAYYRRVQRLKFCEFGAGLMIVSLLTVVEVL